MKIKDDKFWNKVVKTGTCWIWRGYKLKSGYGTVKRVRLHPRPLLAHRYAFYLYHGKFPDNNCCHTCDNPSCVNPNHLFDATQKDNVKDMIIKGRGLRGSRVGTSKLTEEDVADIKKCLSKGVPQSKIAFMYGVGQTIISNINTGLYWKQV